MFAEVKPSLHLNLSRPLENRTHTKSNCCMGPRSGLVSFADKNILLQMKFRQLKPGIMKRFEGFWRLEPIYVDEKICMPFKPKTLSDYEMCTGGKGRIGSRVILEQLLQPAIVPPPPLSWYLRGITAQTTETLLNYLFEEVDRIKGVSQVQNSSQDQKPAKEVRNERNIDEIYDIKQRWALRRRQSILHRKR